MPVINSMRQSMQQDTLHKFNFARKLVHKNYIHLNLCCKYTSGCKNTVPEKAYSKLDCFMYILQIPKRKL